MARLNRSSFRTLGLNVMSGSELNSIRSSNYSIQWVCECGHPGGRVCLWFWQLVIRIPFALLFASHKNNFKSHNLFPAALRPQ